MEQIKAFFMGVREFRSASTTGYYLENGAVNEKLLNAYDWGREWAHRLTFRRYDDSDYKGEYK